MLTVAHADIVVENLVLDGQFGTNDLVRVESDATRFVLRNTEVRRTSRDAVDMGAVQDVVIDGVLIHDALDPDRGRTDAHGIVAGAARHLTIRNTEIHTFSGDAVQIDPDRGAPGWTDVLIENCRFWLQPLTAATNGFPAGTVPGENAVDTKAGAAWPRAKLTIRNTEAFGFRKGLISNMAAFNIKEHVDVVVDGVTVYDSEIAFRLRAPAQVQLQNVVIHTVDYAVRYEDGLENLRIWNTTIGGGVGRAFLAATSRGSTLDVRNLLVLGTGLPGEAAGRSNMAVPASAFIDAAAHDYRLSDGSPAIDAGVEIEDVRTDRVGITRPQGAGYDVGAFERQAVTLRGDQRTTGGTGERRNGGCRAAMESAYDGRTEGQGPSTSSDRGADTGRAAGRRPACEWVPGRAGKPRRSLGGLPARPGTHSTARTRGPDPAA